MRTRFQSALYANTTLTQKYAAIVAAFDALAASAALFAPHFRIHIAIVAIRAMIALVQGAIHANIVIAAVLITNLPAGAIGTLSAFQAQFAAFSALITVFTIGRAIDPIITIGAPVSRMYRQRGGRNHSDHHNERQQHT